MKSALTLGKRKIILLIFILTILVFALFSNYGLIKRYSITSNHKELITTINEYKNQIDSLNKRLKTLENNHLEIEKLAREKYGLIKPGEKIIYIEKK